MAELKKGLLPLASPDSRILLLGTMPGDRSIMLQQYYGNPGNSFWKLMFAVFDQPFSSEYEQRIALVRKYKIALWNVLRACVRKGSGDNMIRDAEPNKLHSFLDLHPQVQYVFFESITAGRLHDRYQQRRSHITYQVLPSCSGRYAAMTFEQKLQQWNKLRSAAE